MKVIIKDTKLKKNYDTFIFIFKITKFGNFLCADTMR